MARIIPTHETRPADFGEMEREWIYNGLDCCVTRDVFDAIHPQLDPVSRATYDFSRELQGPVLEMRLRGVLIDKHRRAEVLDEYFEQLEHLKTNLERIVLDGVGMLHFNPSSPADKAELFYERLHIPPIMQRGRPTTNRAALEKMESYIIARPIVHHLQAIADIAKKIQFLRMGIDTDGRARTSYNIAGTNTGRFSSSFSEFGTGGNFQNVEESLRSVFVADPGYKFAKFDAKSGESFCVGAYEWNLFNDGTYLDACETGDPHTAVARIMWPELDWTGDLAHDKHVAETPYYRHYTYRFMCKKLGHGSNYGGQAATLSQQAKVPINLVHAFQPLYFKMFPAHLLWQNWTDETLRKIGTLTTLTGRRRQFWGRRTDHSTLREAIAYGPQGSLADLVNRAMLNIWRKTITGEIRAQLMLQDHDALTFQYRERDEDTVVPQLLSELIIPIPLANGRTLEIPYDAKVGWNRADYNEKKNPDGLKDYVTGDKRKRQPQVGLLDRKLR